MKKQKRSNEARLKKIEEEMSKVGTSCLNEMRWNETFDAVFDNIMPRLRKIEAVILLAKWICKGVGVAIGLTICTLAFFEILNLIGW